MNVYEQALLFNNHGVALLASGSNNEQREAIAKFRCALAVIKAGIIDETKKVGDNDHSSNSSSNREEPATTTATHHDITTTNTTSSSPCCLHHKEDEDDENDDNCEQARNTNIQLNIQDFLEPVVVPFPELCHSGEDEDFFLYRHAFIVSRSSSFSPSWEISQQVVHAGDDATTNLRPRKRSFSGTSSTRNSEHTQIPTPPLPNAPLHVSSPTNNNVLLTSSIKPGFPHVREHQEPCCGSYNPLSLDLLSSVVVFNMALAHNLEGASQQYKIAMGLEHTATATSEKQHSLSALNEVSRRLYDMSIGLLGNVLRAQEASKSVIEAMAILAASSNNLAKILFDQGKIQTARSTLKTLWHTTSWICEKVLFPQQEGKVAASSSFLAHQQQQRSMVSHVMPRADSMITTITPESQNQPWSSSNNATAGDTRSNERTTFDEIDGNFLARTPGRERTNSTTAAAFLFSETDMEGFIMNVMLMYHSQPPIAAKAA